MLYHSSKRIDVGVVNWLAHTGHIERKLQRKAVNVRLEVLSVKSNLTVGHKKFVHLVFLLIVFKGFELFGKIEEAELTIEADNKAYNKCAVEWVDCVAVKVVMEFKEAYVHEFPVAKVLFDRESVEHLDSI
jgi:hypothetical protein